MPAAPPPEQQRRKPAFSDYPRHRQPYETQGREPLDPGGPQPTLARMLLGGAYVAAQFPPLLAKLDNPARALRHYASSVENLLSQAALAIASRMRLKPERY